ncbi:TATA-binding protein-associated factor [Nematocida minor]|uniref:TATA-binding protein-associated factor n=1 Tax=Nematocida minor TaxID=1912983 RepID=UPI0022210CC6|nr:TATA-binding protein-associated factor [Nematocida minor]XP_051332091.1 TATA-binding protein-associated factor [Nematocida minor]KAI5188821.1 TATA-binding protein-associated factor [Nematocida minor]KAI5188925.1 TATA-binding protein-associated factor [Nematocida minor]
MTSITKLFKTLRSAPSKGVKRHITNEITAMYCTTPALVDSLLEEILFLSESSAWEDRLAGSRILEEMARLGTISDAFASSGYELAVEIDALLKMPKFLATHYTANEAVKGGKEFIDLEDHNVVLSLSNINIPGTKAKEDSLLRRKKQLQKAQKIEEKKELEGKEDFYQNVLKNLESFVWERRHGASQLLLGLFRGIHLREEGVLSLKVLDSKEYLQPMLKVLILDRFNDYEMDTAVSPVRETVAKALRELVHFLTPGTIKDILVLLTQLGKYEDWQIKYSGLLGLQYMQDVISPDDHKEIVLEIGSTCLNLLNDLDEDVKRISASILTGILDQYGLHYGSSGAESEEDGAIVSKQTVQEKINEVLDVEDVVEKCWEALEEEEDLALSKAKIMGLLEKIAYQLGYGPGEVTKERWNSVLCLVRNPIDTVRLAVLSLLNIIDVQNPESLVASLLFSILAEQDAKIRESTANLLKEKSHSVDSARLQSIVHSFLNVVCSPYTVGASFPSLKMHIVMGEGDICATDDGCKSLGEEAVLSGRTELLKILISSDSVIRNNVASFFLDKKKNLYYFVFFKTIVSMLLMKENAGIEGAMSLVDSLQEDTTERNKNDLSRSAYSLVEHVRDSASKEDAEILVYLYNIPTPAALLKILSEAIGAAPEKFTEFFNLAVECVCVKESTEEKEKEPINTKKIKMTEEIENEEEEWGMLTLFKVLSNSFLETKVFDDLKQDMNKCAIFLQNTIECFKYTEKLQFIFKYAIEHNMSKIISYMIKESMQNNEEFVMIAKKKLEMIVEDESIDHTEFLSFISSTVESSELFLLIVLVFPLVKAMNTPYKVPGLREMASRAFSIASPSMWIRLEGHAKSPGLQKEIESARARVDSLMQPDDLSAINMKVSLREYQKKGVEWIGFLKKSGLSGMLCDDMGLGKTIQVLAFLSSQESISKSSCVLVLCPSALTGHWHMEISSHFPTLFSTTINEFKGVGVCVASFDKFRLNYEKFTKYSWFYLVLDEGHVIRNANTLLHQRVKMLRAENKLLLSGTPVQNSVGELWALFDILMPGFLGSEKDFSRDYIRPIEKAREGKGTLRETEIAKIKLEELHKAVLPFILRRMKETVLSDLPPKVISDVYVDLEEVQQKVYEGLTSEGEASGEYGKISASSGNFALLTRLIKACSHISLLSGNEVPLSLTLKEKASAPSGKVLALLDLLKVMVQNSKILIFCQYKATIDKLVKEVESVLPETKWVRLDGGVKGDERSALAKRFNTDAELSIMYLTTHAGGLGLNLTGADVVIFFEHDWNPMMDLQAMDRAHRIGQKKSVNVFRLISKNTIEESIMSLQRFKNYIAGTVVNQQNVEIESMDTSNALERLSKEKLPQEKVAREEEYHDFI